MHTFISFQMQMYVTVGNHIDTVFCSFSNANKIEYKWTEFVNALDI